jgi:hypothetical protein
MPMLMTLPMRLPVCPFHAPLRTRHLLQHRVDLGNYVLAIHDDRCPSRRAQRHVEHRAVLGDVDLVAAKHGVDPGPKARLFRQ